MARQILTLFCRKKLAILTRNVTRDFNLFDIICLFTAKNSINCLLVYPLPNNIFIYIFCENRFGHIVYMLFKNTNNICTGIHRMKCTLYETCAILHRFHILYLSCVCYSIIEIIRAFLKRVVSSFLKVTTFTCTWISAKWQTYSYNGYQQ